MSNTGIQYLDLFASKEILCKTPYCRIHEGVEMPTKNFQPAPGWFYGKTWRYSVGKLAGKKNTYIE